MTISLETEPSGGPVAADNLRFVAVRANLLPAEVLERRAVVATRRRVLGALAALVGVLTLAFAGAWWQTYEARDDLSTANSRAASLQAQTRSFAPLLSMQQATRTVHAQLGRLMVGDLSWQQLLASLQAQAPRGVALTQVSGSVTTGLGGSTTGAPAATGPTALPVGGAPAIGSLTIVGTAPDKDAVAAYAQALVRIGGVSTPFVNSVTATAVGGGVTFNLTVPITSAVAARSAAATSTGGH